MALTTNQRRDQRRRLVVSWKRSADGTPAASPEPPRKMAAYDPEAHPERQRGPATILPTGIGGLAAAIVLIMLPLVAAVLAGASEQLFGRSLFTGGGRFARTLAAVGAVVDSRSGASLQVWLAELSLVAAAGIATIVRLMRRHRRDDYKGRFRAWGWMAAILLVTACAGVVPVGRLVGAFMSDATGVTLGPDGVGWWIVLASVAVSVVSLWAVLPLHERAATALWLAVALIAWAASAAATWLAGGRERFVVAGLASWTIGAGLALVAMLVAARSVIREVRGQCGARKPKQAKPARDESPRPASPQADDEVDSASFQPAATGDDDGETVYVDGSEQDHRHLSKAERKRLRKLARMNGAAA